MCDIRDTIVSCAREVSGLSAQIPGLKPAFRDLLGPSPKGEPWDIDRPYHYWIDHKGKARTQGVSTCGLVAAGIMREAAKRLRLHPRMFIPWDGAAYWDFPAPFHALDIVSSLSLVNTLHDGFSDNQTPVPGTVACIGRALRTHVLTVVSVDGDMVESVDGGQVELSWPNLQCVRTITRDWTKIEKVNWIIDPVSVWARLESLEAYP